MWSSLYTQATTEIGFSRLWICNAADWPSCACRSLVIPFNIHLCQSLPVAWQIPSIWWARDALDWCFWHEAPTDWTSEGKLATGALQRLYKSSSHIFKGERVCQVQSSRPSRTACLCMLRCLEVWEEQIRIESAMHIIPEAQKSNSTVAICLAERKALDFRNCKSWRYISWKTVVIDGPLSTT